MRTVLLSVGITLALTVSGLWAFFHFTQPSPAKRPQGMPTPLPEGEGWIDLISEENVSLWKNITDDMDLFEIRDGILHLWGKSVGKLRYAGYTGRTFKDFDLHLEFKVARRANSGVFLRVLPNDPVRRGFEIQVLDDHGKLPSLHGTGAVYDVVMPMFNMSRPAGEWNSFDISVHGKQIVVIVNGWKVIDTDFALMTAPIGKFSIPYAELPQEGLLALQDHGGEVWYRNIRVKPAADSTPEGQ